MRLDHRKPIIGLTGGIGAGKSLVAGILQQLGAAVVDSDRLAHEELCDPHVLETLRAWWGDAVAPAGQPDRKALGRIVFSDPAELKRLEELLYPRIEGRRRVLVGEFERNPAVRAIVYDAPKLYEAGLDRKCDRVVFVDAPRAVRKGRAQRAHGWGGGEFEKREKMLDPLEIKKAKADYVVSNQSDIATLRSTVERVFNSVLASCPG